MNNFCSADARRPLGDFFSPNGRFLSDVKWKKVTFASNLKRMKIKTIFRLLTISGLLLPSAALLAQENHGGEQGMETTYIATIENEQAIREADSGWWTESQKTLDERMEWFSQAKFGMFIHWGVYSQAGGKYKGRRYGGYAEHLMRVAHIPVAEYTDSLVRTFDPERFDADEWMRLAKDAGMRYMVITAKHHDGFAMFPSKAYPYDIRMTKCKVDPMAELCKAAHKYGLKFGFYYSHAFDWEHPDAPGNDWEFNNPGGDKLLFGREWWLRDPQFMQQARKYVDQKCLPQIKELIEQYHPDILWFDTPHKLPFSENLRVLKFIRSLDSNVVVNGRLAHIDGRQFGDYTNTGDRAAFLRYVPGYWEAIPTTNESYGYCAHDRSHKPASHFIRLLASAVARGGNILLNIGPKGDGSIDMADVQILEGVGRWMKTSGKSIYGASRSGLPTPAWGESTRRNDTLFLHVFRYPKDGKLLVNGLKGVRLRKARFLASGTSLRIERVNDSVQALRLPKGEFSVIDSVIAVRYTGQIVPTDTRLLEGWTENLLPAFDAKVVGDSVSYGDGKVLRNYVSGWTRPDSRLEWTTHTLQPKSWRFSIEYTGINPQQEGELELWVDGNRYPVNYAGCRPSESRTIDITTQALSAGMHRIALRAVSRKGSELPRLLNLKITSYEN